MSKYCVIGLVAVFVIGVQSVAAADSHGYVRFCTAAQRETESQLKAINDSQRKRFPVQESDAKIVETATQAIGAANLWSTDLSAPVTLAARFYGEVTGRGPFAPDEAMMFRVNRKDGASHVVVTFDQTGKAKAVRLATLTEVEWILNFGRVMPPYMLFNDLTASDTVIPRYGCGMAFREQIYALPEVLPEALNAVHAQPAEDPVLLVVSAPTPVSCPALTASQSDRT
jgi:hypothetical protein